MSPDSYAVLCAVLCGVGNLIVWAGNDASVFISESVLHSVSARDPGRIGAHDGYYGQSVANAVCMLSTLVVPCLTNHFRSKWVLALCALFFTFYFGSFLLLNRYLYFVACVILGMALSTFMVGFTTYLTEFSTRQTMERNLALSWAVTSFKVLGAGVVNFIVTTINTDEKAVASQYREYSDAEIRYFFGAFTVLGLTGTILYSSLPNREVPDNIAASNVKIKSVKDQLAAMLNVLVNTRVLILTPYYLYVGISYSFWFSILPTSFQFTKALSTNVYIPAYYGIVFCVGSVLTCLLIMKLSSVMKNFSFKPLMIINATVHVLIYTLVVCMIPKWSTVRPNDDPSLLIQPSVYLVFALAFLCGVADAANNTTRQGRISNGMIGKGSLRRTVICSLLIPARRQQSVGAARFHHGLAASVLFFVSPYLSIYSYVIILSSFLVVATIAYLYTCEYIQSEERKALEIMPPVTLVRSQSENALEKL